MSTTSRATTIFGKRWDITQQRKIKLDDGLPHILLYVSFGCAFLSVLSSVIMMIMHRIEFLPAAIAIQIASAFIWLALIAIYVILLIDHNDKPYDLDLVLLEAQIEINETIAVTIPIETPAKEAQHNERMITIIAELIFLILLQLYISYVLYGVYKEQRIRRVSFQNQAQAFAAFSPIQFSFGEKVYVKKPENIALHDY